MCKSQGNYGENAEGCINSFTHLLLNFELLPMALVLQLKNRSGYTKKHWDKHCRSASPDRAQEVEALFLLLKKKNFKCFRLIYHFATGKEMTKKSMMKI